MCPCGGALVYCWYPKKKITTPVLLATISFAVILLGGGQNVFAQLVADDTWRIHLAINRRGFAIYWLIILWLLFSRSGDIENLCGRKRIFNDHEHSFYVYILHFIVLKTVIIWIFSVVMNVLGFGFSAIIATICAVIITAISSVYFGICYKYVDRIVTQFGKGWFL